MAKIKFKKNFRNFLAIALAILVGAGAIFGIVKLSEKLTSETKKITPSYQVGGIDVSGKGNDSKDSIVTKEAFECQGLKITPEFGANIEYQVFFYGANDVFLECSEVMSDTYNYCPTWAGYARVVIYPQSDEDNDDVEVKWYQVRKYAKLLTIEVNRKQDFVDISTVDFFQEGEHKIGYVVEPDFENMTYTEIARALSGYIKINVSDVKKVKMTWTEDNPSQALTHFFANGDTVVGSPLYCFEGDLERTFEVVEGAKVLYVNYSLGKEFSITLSL